MVTRSGSCDAQADRRSDRWPHTGRRRRARAPRGGAIRRPNGKRGTRPGGAGVTSTSSCRCSTSGSSGAACQTMSTSTMMSARMAMSRTLTSMSTRRCARVARRFARLSHGSWLAGGRGIPWCWPRPAIRSSWIRARSRHCPFRYTRAPPSVGAASSSSRTIRDRASALADLGMAGRNVHPVVSTP